MRAIIFANGDLNPGPFVEDTLAAAADALLIAADGGARHCATVGLVPHVIIGDMDSLAAKDLDDWQTSGAAVHRFPPAKDETDLELALVYAGEQGVDWIRIIGGIGDRLDQTLANVLLLTQPALTGCDMRLVAGRQSAWILHPGTHPIRGAVNDTLSLIPLGGDASGVYTEGLEYPLRDEPLYFGPARGISNVFSADQAVVRVETGLLMVVHTLGKA